MSDVGSDVCFFSVSELLNSYRRGIVSPVEVIKAVFAKIKKNNGQVNAFSFLNEELAVAAAEKSEKRWMEKKSIGCLDGIPVTVKDLLPVKDWNIRRGSKIDFFDTLEPTDSPAAARLREHNSIFIGSTATPEFGWKGVTDSPLMGITKNPWDFTKTPGGSSGGAAVAAALGMGALHVGSDGGGSLRIPASFTGVFGFKGTAGRVPVYPESILGSMYHVGPITRSVKDASLVMNVISKPDNRDWSALPYDGCNYDHQLNLEIGKLRIAFSPRLGFAEVDTEVASLVKGGVKILEDAGACIEEVDPNFSCPINCFTVHWGAALHNFIGSFSDENKRLLDPGLLDLVTKAASINLSQYQDAMGERVGLTKKMTQFFNEYDLLITPTLPIPAFGAGEAVPNPSLQKMWPDWSPFSYPFNLTGQPACSIPCGFNSEGLPVGIQFVSARYNDHLLMEMAKLFERCQPFTMP